MYLRNTHIFFFFNIILRHLEYQIPDFVEYDSKMFQFFYFVRKIENYITFIKKHAINLVNYNTLLSPKIKHTFFIKDRK